MTGAASLQTPPPSRAGGAIHLPRFAGEERGQAAPPRAGELSAKPAEGALAGLFANLSPSMETGDEILL